MGSMKLEMDIYFAFVVKIGSMEGPKVIILAKISCLPPPVSPKIFLPAPLCFLKKQGVAGKKILGVDILKKFMARCI